jgi:TonB family protein
MRKILFLACLVIALTSVNAFAQVTAKKPVTSSSTAETEPQKDSIDKLVDEAKERGELIFGACLVEDCENANANGVEVGHAIEVVQPDYPPIARAAHASGTVEVKVIIDVDGSVIAAAAISGHPLLQAASVKAARQTRFTPSKLNGDPVKVVGVLQYNFVSQ